MIPRKLWFWLKGITRWDLRVAQPHTGFWFWLKVGVSEKTEKPIKPKKKPKKPNRKKKPIKPNKIFEKNFGSVRFWF
jgi:hypothetical protein